MAEVEKCVGEGFENSKGEHVEKQYFTRSLNMTYSEARKAYWESVKAKGG